MNLDNLLAKIDALLDGIDRQEDDPRGGFWKTLDGAKVGKIMLRNLKELLTAELAQPGPWVDDMPCDFTRTLLRPAYEPRPGNGSADGAQLVNLAWWHPMAGSDSLQIVVDNARAILARQGRPTVGLTDEKWDALKERLWDHYETVGYQGERFMYDTDFYTALDAARQELARYGRPAVAPKPGEVEELVQWLTMLRDHCDGIATGYNDRLTRVATLLQRQAAPTSAVVPEDVTLNWSEERQPCKECRYNHCIAETPFGRFLISWKGWKAHPVVTVDESPFGDCLESWNSVEAAKSWCQAEYSRRLAVAVTKEPQP